MPDATPTPTPPPDVNVPEGYVLLNKAPSELWAKSVLDKLNALNEEADARNPDLQDMCASVSSLLRPLLISTQTSTTTFTPTRAST
jgi:hypothetical protein